MPPEPGEAGQGQVAAGFQVGAGVAGSGAWRGESPGLCGGGEGHISPWVLGAYLASTTHSAPPSPPFSPPPWLTKLVAFMSMMPSEISPGPTASAGGEGQLQINPYLL